VSYWLALAAVSAIIALYVVDRRRRRARFAALRERWGHPVDRVRDFAAIGAYHRAQRDTAPGESLDDRTWDDLNMHDVFAVLDRTESVVGQQVLYARLRAAPTGRHLDAFEAMVTRLSDDRATREGAQIALGRLNAPSGYDIWSLAGTSVLQPAWWQAFFPIAGFGMVALAVLVPFWPPAILLLAAGAIGSLAVRVRLSAPLRQAAAAFRQVGPLVAAGEALADLGSDAGAEIAGHLREDVTALRRLRRIAGWAGRDSSAAIGGDIAGLVVEYLNMLLWLDANMVFFGARELSARGPALRRVFAAVGEIDAAISVASFRAGTPGWTRPSFADSGPLHLDGIRHPILIDAVPNSLELAPPHGVTITGSNMSGKSTFLRTVGVSVVMAQTINTCLARGYAGPHFIVQSCIGRTDDLASGKSYYLAEVESVLALVHAARGTAPRLMLFDELFRGTNAVERIAAGEAVLRSLIAPTDTGRPSPHAVLAATHDQELVELLGDTYAAFHFTDHVSETGLTFDYTLKPGTATTRNAIALLEQRGAPSDLVAHANRRAKMLEALGNRLTAPLPITTAESPLPIDAAD
jgi:hypothetical protein